MEDHQNMKKMLKICYKLTDAYFENEENIKNLQQDFENTVNKLKECFNLEDSDFEDENKIKDKYFEYILMKKRLREAALFDSSAVSVSCNVHGMINLHSVLKNIIDTPQFQRLRRLRQLGVTCFVYPTAMHTRFEHCIGVSHLAGQLVNQLAELQPELNITKKEILCVKIAGLCHDLGHGPFSHMFDRFYEKKNGIKWNHEEASCDLLDDIIKNNKKVKDSLERCGIFKDDITIIKTMIKGIDKKSSVFTEHQQKKRFLYEIVANNRFGLDVDKLDYLSRDCLNLGLSLVSANFDHKRIMHNLRVNKVDGNFELCPRDKIYKSILKMFELRQQLFDTAYCHKTRMAVECMLVDAMMLACEYINEEKKLDISKLDDETLWSLIRTSSCTKLNMVRAQELLCRIEQRDLYKLIGETVNLHYEEKENTSEQEADQKNLHENEREQPSDNKKKNTFEQNIVQEDLQNLLGNSSVVNKGVWDDIVVDICVINLGMRDQNPADKTTYYSKIQPEYSVFLEIQPDLKPRYAMKEIIRLYSKEKSADWNQETYDKRVNAFIEWCNNKGLPAPNKSGQSLKRKVSATSQ